MPWMQQLVVVSSMVCIASIIDYDYAETSGLMIIRTRIYISITLYQPMIMNDAYIISMHYASSEFSLNTNCYVKL